ncbi:MAG TPA: redoxin domain-containing protein [Candidatus Nanoarchaeia archaeon]|nr:redoxin domain-containing protein [Candidatus Nanoarchaeia archaeon]
MQVNQQVSDFEADAFHDNEIKKLRLSDFKGKWVVLLFYPGDFTFICPTELEGAADHYDEFKKLNAEVLSVSVDSPYVHKAWHDASAAIKKIQFPMLSDLTGKLSKQFGVYIEDKGIALRGTFLIDPDGVLKTFEVHDNSIGRSIDELLRKLQAAIFVREHKGEVCPVNWKPGSKTLKPGLDLVGKI